MNEKTEGCSVVPGQKSARNSHGDLNPGSATYELGDFREVTWLPGALVFSSAVWGEW